MADDSQEVADIIDGLGEAPAPLEVYNATRDYDTRYLASAGAAAAAGGGGGSQPGAMRVEQLDQFTAADVTAGEPTLLYTPAAGEYVIGIVILDFAFVGASEASLQIGPLVSDEHAALALLGPSSFVPADALAASFYVLSGQGALATNDPIYGGLGAGYGLATAWQSNHAYGEYGAVVIATGHLWTGTEGTSGGSTPDFAGNIGGSVADNDITWTDTGAFPTQGSLTIWLILATGIA